MSAVPKLICLRGYSGSGKSTIARDLAKENDAVVVNRDHLRLMMLGEWWTGKSQDEDRVTLAEEAQVNALLTSGISTIVDATHLHAPYARKWAKMATRLGADFNVVDVRVDEIMCIARDAKRDRKVGAEVIRKQAKRWPIRDWPVITAKPFIVEPAEFVPSLESAIIVDIDGTLAHMGGKRSPYDYTKVMGDDIDPVIREIVNNYYYSKPGCGHVIIVSGRDDTCRRDTEQWLAVHGVKYCELIMRPAGAKDENGNKLPDYIVKYNLFNQYLRGRFNIEYVLDDRDQVVTQCWRALGLKCLQVAPGDF